MAKVDNRHAAAGETQPRDFLGIRRSFKSISWFTAIKFTALIAAMALLATGHLFVGIAIGTVALILLLHDLGNAAANAKAIRNEVQLAKDDIGEATELLAGQSDQIRHAQERAAAVQQNFEAARANAAELQQANAALRTQAASDQEAFAAVGDQLTGIAEQFDAYAVQVQASIQDAVQEVSSSKEQISTLLAAANGAIQDSIREADAAIDEQSAGIDRLIGQQRDILRRGIEAYKNSDRPAAEKIQALTMAVSQAASLNTEIATQSAALYSETKAAIGKIKDTVTVQMQELNRQFVERHTNLASKLVNLSGLVAQQEAIKANIANLRQQHGTFLLGRRNLSNEIAEQEGLLAEVQRNIKAGREECSALGGDLEQFVSNNCRMAEIVASLDRHLSQIDSHAQSVASGFSWTTMLGVGGGAAVGAMAMGGLMGLG
ncbi:MAG: hypothetical protein LBD33_01505, partial [Puniceicoccales bacterium]|nr:hypothetical protein [Puniceicoccales bacterium]